MRCVRYRWESVAAAGDMGPVDAVIECSQDRPELSFGYCWMIVDEAVAEIAKHEIHRGAVVDEAFHFLYDDVDQFKALGTAWLGWAFPDHYPDLDDGDFPAEPSGTR